MLDLNGRGLEFQQRLLCQMLRKLISRCSGGAHLSSDGY